MINSLHRNRLLFCLALTFLLGGPLKEAEAQGDSEFKFVEIKVVDPDGKPLADVAIDVDLDGMQFPMPTNDEGVISMNVPGGTKTRLRLNVIHDDYVADPLSWRGGKSIPEEYTIKLEKGVPIGGLVHDEEGKPIEGVVITSAVPQVTAEKTASLQSYELARTDNEGRWKAAVKDAPKQDLLLKLSHDDYLSDSSLKKRASWEELKTLEHALTMEKGPELTGQVTDPEGQPIEGAIVFVGPHRYANRDQKKTTYTDQEGKYKFVNVQAGNDAWGAYGGPSAGTVITVAAEGWAPELRAVQIKKGMKPVDFQLQPGKSIEILVTDVDDVPIEGAKVVPNQWRNHQTLPIELYDGVTNAEGIWQSESMPADPVHIQAHKHGYMQSGHVPRTASDEQQKIVLHWPLTVTGKVVDAESGLPVEKFNVVQGIDWGNSTQQVHWERYNIKTGTDGKYQTEFTYPREGHYVRIEADGYRPEVSRMLRSEEGDVKINFELEEGAGPKGKILTPDGKPASGTELLVATPEEQVMIYNGHAQQHEGRPATTADAEGRYQLPFLDASKTIVVCRHESGYAQIDGNQLEESSDITLSAWAGVEGTAFVGDSPLANTAMQLYYYQQRWNQGEPRVFWSYTTQTDDAGKFHFKRVAGTDMVVARTVAFGDTGNGAFMSSYSHTQRVTLEPGLTMKVKIGGEGRTLKGRLKVPEGYAEESQWNMATVQVSQQNPAQSGGFFRALGHAIGQLGSQSQAQPKIEFRRNYATAVDDTGNFVIEDVLPGNYQLTVQLYPPRQDGQHYWQPLGTCNKVFEIPENKGENEQDAIDLGELTLTMTGSKSNQGFIQLAPAAE